jgi:TonB family protein
LVRLIRDLRFSLDVAVGLGIETLKIGAVLTDKGGNPVDVLPCSQYTLHLKPNSRVERRMRRFVILVFLFVGVVVYSELLIGQTDDSGMDRKSENGRLWKLGELDTLQSHRWVWRDESFKEIVPESLCAVKGIDSLPTLRTVAVVEYPKEALQQGVQADVRLRVLIDKKGKVRCAYVLMNSGSDSLGFEEFALEAAKGCTWQFPKGKGWGEPKWVSIMHKFRLTMADSLATSDLLWWSVEEEDDPSMMTPPMMTTAKALQPIGSYEFATAPTPINLPFTEYPQAAMRKGKQAVVWVKVLIDEKGKPIRDAITIQSADPNLGFEESALKAPLQAKWKPSLLHGKPVATWVSYKITYQLGRGR